MECKIVLAVVVVLVCFPESNGTNCYICRDCNDPFDPNDKATRNCAYSCWATKIEDAHGNKRVSRDCGLPNKPDGCSKKIAGDEFTVCYCNTDLCNGAEIPDINGIKCFSCDDCNDPFDPNGKPTKNCDTSCETKEVKVLGRKSMKRGCASVYKRTDGCSKLDISGVESTVCYCNTDLCNGAEIPEINGIKCFSCDDCNDPFDPKGKPTKNCDTSCKKTKVEVAGIESVTRGCASVNHSDGCLEMNILGVTGTGCYCNTGLCNAAVSAKLTITFMFAVGSGILLFHKIL